LITGREDYLARLHGIGRTAKTRASAQLTAPLRDGHAVVPRYPRLRPRPAVHTAWLPRSSSWNDMAGAAMSYGLVRKRRLWRRASRDRYGPPRY